MLGFASRTGKVPSYIVCVLLGFASRTGQVPTLGRGRPPRPIHPCLPPYAQQVKKYLKKGDGKKLEDGSYDENYGKNAIFKEFGQTNHQGTADALQEAVLNIAHGVYTINDLLLQNAMLVSRHKSALERAEMIWATSPDNQLREKPTCKWFMGPSGCGKSRKAFDDYGYVGVHRPSLEDMAHEWGWDTYDNKLHETIVIDDVDGQLKFKFALRLMDRYPMAVRRRCKAPVAFKSKNIIFTSTRRPEEIWRKTLEDGENFHQWYRRCELWKYNEVTKEFDHIENPEHDVTNTTENGSYAPMFVRN